MLRIFVSSTFRDLEPERKELLERLSSALEPAGMEVFIPTGKDSQSVALEELEKSDVVIFLISHIIILRKRY
jgi:hypothetical protein